MRSIWDKQLLLAPRESLARHPNKFWGSSDKSVIASTVSAPNTVSVSTTHEDILIAIEITIRSLKQSGLEPTSRARAPIGTRFSYVSVDAAEV